MARKTPDAVLLARKLADLERALRHCDSVVAALSEIEHAAGTARVAASDALRGIASAIESLRE